MQRLIELPTHQREELVNLTEEIHRIVRESGIRSGLVALYAQDATTALMVQKGGDTNVCTDMIRCFQALIPADVKARDHQEGNSDAHLKAGLVGPSETIPIINGELVLATWQNIFLCELDGPRNKRTVVYTAIRDT